MTFLTSQFGVIDSNNSSGLALPVLGSFVGAWTLVSNYASFTVTLFLQAAQSVQLQIEESSNPGVVVRVTNYFVTQESQTQTFTVTTSHVRVQVLANQGTAATGYVQTLLHSATALPPVQRLDTTLTDASDSVTTRSLMVGEQNGGYANVSIDASTGGIVVQPTDPTQSNQSAGLYDSYFRLRTSVPNVIRTNKLTSPTGFLRNYDNLQVSGAGTSAVQDLNRASVVLSVSATTAGLQRVQGIRPSIYAPGVSVLNYFTVTVGTTGAGIVKRFGVYNDNNGLFYQITNGTLQVVIRSSTSGAPVDTVVSQGSFNGAVPPGYTLTQTALFGIDFSWLGAGRVRFFMIYDSQYFLLHNFGNSALTAAYNGTPVVPFRYEIENDGTGAASTLEVICNSKLIEDVGETPDRLPVSANRGSSSIRINNNGNDYVLMALRLNPARLSTVVQFRNFNIAALSGITQFLYKLVYRPTLSGALAWISPYASDAQYAIPGNNNTGLITATGGIVVASGYEVFSNQTSTATQTVLYDWFLGYSATGTPYELVLTVQKIDGGAPDDFIAALNWTENM